MKRVAVIGAGGMGRFHANTLMDIPGVEVAELCDPFPSNAVEALGIPITTKPHVCAAKGWDGVVIASPDTTHAELTLLALDAGSRILCEKPLSHDLAGARSVIDAELSLGDRRVQVGFMREYDAAHIELATRLEGRTDLHYLRCTHRNTNEDARPRESVLVQSLIHDIHTVRWMAGQVQNVDARVVPRPGGLMHVLLVLDLESGRSATIEFSDDGPAYSVVVEASCEAGIWSTGQEATEGEDWFAWFADAYQVQDRVWVESLDAPTASGPSAADGLAAQLVAEAALSSIEHGVPIQVELFEVPELYR